MIGIKALSKSFGNNKVLDNINCDFSSGKVYGIVGKNGSGKTTLFNCIAGIETYDGNIDSPFEKLKNHIGFLLTNQKFMSKITGWEYLKLYCIARDIKEDDFESKNIFNLPLNQYAETYSTGMKKKLALMAILLQKNDIYILDEPFNGVDLQSNVLITEIIQKLKAQGKLILISSHIYSTLKELCDQIILLQDCTLAKKVDPDNYEALETEMKATLLGTEVDKLI